MDFADWNLLKEIENYISKLNYHLITKNNEIHITFPNHQMRQVAHIEYIGDNLNETIKHNKGKAAYENMPLSAHQEIGIDKIGHKKAMMFQDTLTKKIRSISYQLGILFECEIFIILSAGKKIKGRGIQSITALKQEKLKEIKNLTSESFIPIIERFIHHHALTMCESIHQTAISINCTDTIEFFGGSGDFNVEGRNTADIIISCSKNNNFPNKTGFSLKFGSDTRVHVGMITSNELYSMMGGHNVDNFSHNIKINSKGLKTNDFVSYLLNEMKPVFEQATKDKYVLNDLINKILLGNEFYDGLSSISNTFLAYRDYVRNSGNAEISKKLSNDFEIHPNEEYKLTIREDSNISMTVAKSYISINIKGPTSKSGTTIRFTPDKNFDPSRNTVDFDIAMTNLT